MPPKSKVLSSFAYPVKIKKDLSAPERFSRRLRKLPPASEFSLDTLIKKIKKERSWTKYKMPRILTRNSTTTNFSRSTKNLKYPPGTVNSKEVFSILSAPRCRPYKTISNRHLKKECQASIEVQIGNSFANPRMVLRDRKKPNTKDTLSKTTLRKRGRPKSKHDNKSVGKLTEKRKSYVLALLNSGSIRDIQKLQTVGSKTAERILLYRQLKGSFKHISDLGNIPDFHSRKIRRFFRLNYIHY